MTDTITPDVVTVGSMAIDSIRTPAGDAPNCLGGAAVHGSMSASFFARVGLVGVVGHDYPPHAIAMLEERSIDLCGVQHADGKTFFWQGYYEGDMGDAFTEVTDLNVFADFQPELPASHRKAPFLFLANIHPALQLYVLEQMESPLLTMADTMNFWITGEKDALTKVIQKVNVMFMNDAELRQYTGIPNVVKAARAVLDLGPDAIIVKKGGNGAVMFSKAGDPEGPLGMSYFSAPAYPIPSLTDPTGAGDSFAGGFIGYLAKVHDTSEAAMRRGIIYGSVMASFNVEDFSMNRVRRLTWPEIETRFARFEKIVAF
ncbi:MAG TPA: PfkB family carbohydrate kinase [Armatimonadota bacterium]|jgi:sugar/nucleoside kinase (ribokinase family)